ncbi:hypothetical protein CU669_04020 [Paramagnetospirillum kuznetsovii]|uniref:DUF4159 domain-containing protein n=1 Tax=Paramagnetospirillum kuznetsovii TaxID=2053833 RepID=A0A364P1W2_9PROT|nr:DUF4159 domain-containing protein [Paramagnetospirillum kuznetsovii]RAU23314.1 hypothetical protein CU669_04020 [Paramagnetospirillum kuznetsovii]
MSFLPGLAFSAPWALLLLALLPLLWRLLKVTPPAPRLVRFPAIRLLFGLKERDETAETTPPWLLLLRLALAFTLVLAAARPVFSPHHGMGNTSGPLLVVVDDGWAAARDWPARRAFLDRLLEQAGRQGRPVLLLGTAPPAHGGPVALGRMMSAAEARPELGGLEPKPWATDRRAALAALQALAPISPGRTVWLADGLDGDGAADFARALQSLGGGLELVGGRSGRQLLPPAEDGAADRLTMVMRRVPSALPERLVVRGLDASGTVLAREEVEVDPRQTEASIALSLPVELRNRLVRLDLDGERGAGATVLLDERWRRRRVGLVAGGASAGAPLLDRLYYIERALAPYAEVRRGDLADLLGETGPDMLIMADLPLTPGALTDRLIGRVEAGGVLLRFAGPLLAQAVGQSGEKGDPLLPVRLRDGGRAMGGAMSWTTPMAVAPFPEGSPFHGLAVATEVEVKAQVLAEPSLDLAAHSWALLADGTPLVTAARRGKGWVVLIHTGANAEWSNLPLSGLFVQMLRRVAALSRSGGLAPSQGALPPMELLDGFGRLGPATGIAAALTEGAEVTVPGPRHPPGYYGAGEGRVAFNLAPRLGSPRPLAVPPGARISGLEAAAVELDLGPALLVLALLLAMADGLASLWLQGGLRRLAPLLVLLAALPAEAAESFALEAGQATRLACIKTFDAAMDRDCLAGLKGLSAVLATRSTANLAEPMAVDLERDPVVFFPLLYWRITPNQRGLSFAAADKLNAYMARGGLIVFDTGDEGQPGAGPDTAELNRLRVLVQGLALPPLVPLAADHVLNRAFYLLKEVPGRWDGATVWVEQTGRDSNDGVSPVLLGGNDWVGAWAVDERGKPLHAVTPGGERQREMAYRFGVNLVMYALTGNYKADQVHLPAILERLGR